MSRRSTQCTRYAIKIKDEFSEVKRKISGKAKNNHSTVGFKGLTHPISCIVTTCTACTVLASAAQANITAMQRPNSATGRACLCHCAYGIHTGTHLFLPLNRHHFVPSYCCTAVLISARKLIRMNAESSIRSELTISSCLGLLLIIVLE